MAKSNTIKDDQEDNYNEEDENNEINEGDIQPYEREGLAYEKRSPENQSENREDTMFIKG